LRFDCLRLFELLLIESTGSFDDAPLMLCIVIVKWERSLSWLIRRSQGFPEEEQDCGSNFSDDEVLAVTSSSSSSLSCSCSSCFSSSASEADFTATFAKFNQLSAAVELARVETEASCRTKELYHADGMKYGLFKGRAQFIDDLLSQQRAEKAGAKGLDMLEIAKDPCSVHGCGLLSLSLVTTLLQRVNSPNLDTRLSAIMVTHVLSRPTLPFALY